MKKKEYDELLGSDLAQKDKNFLRYAFIKRTVLDDLLNYESPVLVINAPRGSGKSGLLLLHESDLKRSSSEFIIIKKYFEDVNLPLDEKNLTKHINFWSNTILGWIFNSIKKRINSEITDCSISEKSFSMKEIEEYLKLINTISDELKISSKISERIEIDPNIFFDRIHQVLFKSKSTFWILLDEMDDLYCNTLERNHSLVALFQSANYLSSKFNNLRFRITIRPHILTHLQTNFDNIQKLRESIIRYSWSENELKTILARRISYYENGKDIVNLEQIYPIPPNEINNIKYDEQTLWVLLPKYFDDFDMSFKEGKGSKYRALWTVSFGRPRWLIEYCKLALSQSESSKRASIDCFKKAFLEYGQNRVAFISGEFRNMYPYLEAAINSIVSSRRVKIGDYKALRSLINGRVIDNGIINATHENRNEMALEVAKALFMVEFIRAKQDLGGAGENYRFYTYVDRPSLLASWNKEKNIKWEIHPTFSRGLNLEDSQVFRTGNETRSFGRKNK